MSVAYWDRQPCNINHSKHPPGSIEAFVETAGRRYFVEPHIPRFARFDEWYGKRVLDFGCGIGTDAIMFAQRGATVLGVDSSAVSRGIAQQRAQALGLSNIDFTPTIPEPFAGIGTLIPFDLIWAYGSVHHTEDPCATMKALYATLKPGGMIRAMVYNRYSYKNLAALQDRPLHLLDTIAARGAEAQPDCPIVHFYNTESARALFTDADFHVLTCSKWHIFPWKVEDYREGRYVRDPNLEGVDLALLAMDLGQHILIEAYK